MATTAGAKKAGIYVRVSTGSQEENYSLPTQEARCRQYAAEQGWEVAGVWQDVHSGMDLWGRPRIGALRAAARRGDVEIILAYCVDRLSRNQSHLFVLLDEAERHGVQLDFATEKMDDSPLGKVVLALKGFQAEAERERFRERSMRGVRARCESGKLRPGRDPRYGYTYDAVRGVYVIDPTQAPIVRRIFQMAADGVSLRRIGLTLDAEGVPTARGGDHWAHTTVQGILRWEGYTGLARALERRVTHEQGQRRVVRRATEETILLPDGVVPPLVDRATWEMVQAKLVRNRAEAPRRNRDPEAFLLRGGYVRCAHCGRAVETGWHKSQWTGKHRPIYRVLSAGKTHYGCPGTTIPTHVLDDAARTFVQAILSRPDVLAQTLARASAEDATDTDLAAVDRALADIARKQGNLTRRLAALDDDEIAAPVLAELARLGERKRVLGAERETVTARQSRRFAAVARLERLRAWGATVAPDYAALPYARQRDLLSALAVRVTLR